MAAVRGRQPLLARRNRPPRRALYRLRESLLADEPTSEGHLSANSKPSPTRSHQFQMTISTSGRSPSPLSEALVEGVASRRNIRRSLPRSADTLFARETISFHQINIAVAQPKLTQFKETTAPLSAFLASVFGRAGLVLHGETEVRKRKDLVRQFQVRRHEDRFAFSQTSRCIVASSRPPSPRRELWPHLWRLAYYRDRPFT